MTTTTEDDVIPAPIGRIKIALSERPPVEIDPEEWPIIARADWHDGKVESQANRVWTIKVRQHADGRRLVYGSLDEGRGGAPAEWRPRRGGYPVHALVLTNGGWFKPAGVFAPSANGKPDDEETVKAIRRVGGIIEYPSLADECIGNLPAESI